MAFLQSLHGTVALLILCGLLLAEEAGVPLPFAPGEVTLIVAGLLIAAGGLNPYLFLPFAVGACLMGQFLGYSWAAVLGPKSLQAVASRVHQENAFHRVEGRIRQADSLHIAVSRLIPGLRIYTTLVAGAVGVRRRTFFVGVAPATLIWVALFVVLGAVVGVPVEHILNRVARLAVQGAILVVIGVGGYFAVRRIPTSNAAGITALSRWARIVIAALIDIGVVASIVTGLLSIGRRFLGLGLRAGWLDALVALGVITISYVYATRRGAGGTVGETLLRTTYATGHPVPLRPRSALVAARRLLTRRDDQLQATATMLRALAEAERLRLLSYLLEGPFTLGELAGATQLPEVQVEHHIGRLQSAGIILTTDDQPLCRYGIDPGLAPILGQLLTGQSKPGDPQPTAPTTRTSGISESASGLHSPAALSSHAEQ